MARIIFIIFLALIFFGCEEDITSKIKTSKTVTIGTFNLAWLGDRINDRVDRTENDYKSIAEVIKNTKCDIIGLQEIENHSAIKRLLKYLPGYSYYLGKSGGQQNLAVLFKKAVNVEYVEEYMPLAIELRRTRPGLVIKAKYGNFDWIMMVVHFKSTSRYDDTKEKRERSIDLREEQSIVVRHWADSVYKNTKEKDIIIVGDFNDSPLRKKNNTLYPINSDSVFTFLTTNLKSCKYKSLYTIDHIVVSKDAKNRYIQDSRRAYNFFNTLPKEQAELISDHCPVLTNFDVLAPDND